MFPKCFVLALKTMINIDFLAKIRINKQAFERRLLFVVDCSIALGTIRKFSVQMDKRMRI